MVDYRTPVTVLLQGICPTCNLLIHRAARFAALASVCADVNMTHQNPQQRLHKREPNSISLIRKAAKSQGCAFSFFRPTAAARGWRCWVRFHQVAFGKARVRG
jgi:hypothetical protein